MYKFLTKNGQTVALGFGVLVILIFIFSINSGFNNSAYSMSQDLSGLPDSELHEIGFFDSGIAITSFMVIASFLLAFIVFGITDLIKFPKNAIKFLIGGLVLAVIFFALYSMSDVETIGKLPELHDRFDISDKVSKLISGGIKTTVGLLIISVIALVVGEIYSMFK